MIVVMETTASQAQVEDVIKRIEESGFGTRIVIGAERSIVGVLGSPLPDSLQEALQLMPGVEEVVRISKRYKLVSREFHPTDSIVPVRDLMVGGDEVVVIAGPCSVENEKQILETAHGVKAGGASMLRGGAYKPRTSPYEFRGLGEAGLKLLAKAREETGLPIVTEVLSPDDVDLVAEYADVLQIGARNVQNFLLLEAAGKTDKPVLLKRGMSTQIEEWLLAAEYVMAQGNQNVILCERGIRTFETITRNTLDLAAVPVVKRLSHLPIIIDPSHGTGKWYLVPSMMLAAVAAGADGLILEVHPNPDQAMSDGGQSLNLENFAATMPKVARVAEAIGRHARAPELAGSAFNQSS
ncbi:3-deoxy-7-phosphoheptulonate synthase [Nitrolancea hollandica]|uniref:Phospho-2-dehydro-3-deoxyheptonate aldolase n=1 Tax=Nitrolancea hollandica Lb TaxID=1129897 RepID=I4EH73_9BACT|nr:3-deoxy-7-phosphoheptulonate synthase [Nitrolancea hollandica]CCF84035.1 Phospho-2-dehydro-3-deoxyheptonate aldolase [Nitrolancea hollandica Lb]